MKTINSISTKAMASKTHQHPKTILLEASSASDALRHLVEWHKHSSPKLSMAQLARKAGIRSRGYFGDLLSGRRNINARYSEGLADALGLDGSAKTCFLLLVEAENAVSEQQRDKVNAAIKRVRKAMQISDTSKPQYFPLNALVFKVFCVFGLLPNPIRRKDIYRQLADQDVAGVDNAISKLLSAGYIGESRNGLELMVKEIRINSDVAQDEQIQFIADSLDSAKLALPRWYAKGGESCFQSTIISVDSREYRKKIKTIKDTLRELQSSIETSAADELISFNCQIFPVNSPR